MEHQASAYRNESDRKRDMRRRKIDELKSVLRLKLYGYLWKTLWFLKLGKIYSKTMCKLNLYTKFPDGRCMYCGKLK